MKNNLKRIMGLLVVNILVFGFSSNVKAAQVEDCNEEQTYVKVGAVCYDTIDAEVITAAHNGEIVLQKDLTLSDAVDIDLGAPETALTLDLGQKTITGTGARTFNIKQGTVTIKNGKIYNGNSQSDAGNIYIYGSDNETTPYTTVTIENTAVIQGINPIVVSSSGGKNYGTVLTIKGSLINDQAQEGIASAALTVHGKNQTSNLEINIENSAILRSTVEGGAGIFQSGVSKTTVKGTVEGKTGIVVKTGELDIEAGATVTATATEEGTPTPSGNGFHGTGAAIQIESKNGYTGTTTVNVNGGTITSTSNSAIIEYGDAEGTKLQTFTLGTEVTINSAEGKDNLQLTEGAATKVESALAHKVTVTTSDGEEHGTVTITTDTDKEEIESGNNALFGRIIRISVTPEFGYRVKAVTVQKDSTARIALMALTPATSGTVQVTRNGSDFEFIMPNYDVEINIEYARVTPASLRDDVDENAIYFTLVIKGEVYENYSVAEGTTLENLLASLKRNYTNMVGFTNKDKKALSLNTEITDGMYIIATLKDETIDESPKTFDAILNIVALGVSSLGVVGIATKKYLR